jgi:hypothetical protein
MGDHNPVEITWVAVPFSAAEMKRLHRQKRVMAEGTLWAAVRVMLGGQEKPVNLRSKRAVHTLLVPTKDVVGEGMWGHNDPRDDPRHGP